MVNLRISIVNPPVGASVWRVLILDGMVTGGFGRITPIIPLSQPAEFELPDDWIFPAGIWIGVGIPLNGNAQWLLTVNNFNPMMDGYYNPDLRVLGFGEYVFDGATGNFIPGPGDPGLVPGPGDPGPGDPNNIIEPMIGLMSMVIMMELMAGMMEGITP